MCKVCNSVCCNKSVNYSFTDFLVGILSLPVKRIDYFYQRSLEICIPKVHRLMIFINNPCNYYWDQSIEYYQHTGGLS